MSLDIELTREKWVSYDSGKTHKVETETVFESNITHNLTAMAGEAGIYEAIWRPYKLKSDFNPMCTHQEECEFENKQTVIASEIIPLLEKGLADLKARPEHFEQFNSSNGWGMYENFVPFVEEYLIACKQFPDAIIRTSR